MANALLDSLLLQLTIHLDHIRMHVCVFVSVCERGGEVCESHLAWVSNKSNKIAVLPSFIVSITIVRDLRILSSLPAELDEINLTCSLRSTLIRVSLLRRGLRESLIEACLNIVNQKRIYRGSNGSDVLLRSWFFIRVKRYIHNNK